MRLRSLIIFGAGAVCLCIGGARVFCYRLIAPRAYCASRLLDVQGAHTGSVIRRDFTIRNTGLLPLRLGLVHAECKCFSGSLEDTLVWPGGKTTIKTTLSLKGVRESVAKRLFVPTNDPDAPYLVLQARGEPVCDLIIEPANMEIDPAAVRADTVLPVTVRAKSHTKRYRVLRVTCTSPYFTFTCNHDSDGRQSILLRPPFPPPTSLEPVFLLLETNHPSDSQVAIEIKWRRRPTKAATDRAAAMGSRGYRRRSHVNDLCWSTLGSLKNVSTKRSFTWFDA